MIEQKEHFQTLEALGHAARTLDDEFQRLREVAGPKHQTHRLLDKELQRVVRRADKTLPAFPDPVYQGVEELLVYVEALAGSIRTLYTEEYRDG